jgi:hypothetical protein
MNEDEDFKPDWMNYQEGFAAGVLEGREQIKQAIAAPVQEPVAFFDPQGKGFYWAKPTKVIAPVTVDVKPLPLYATPPAAQRQFIGLTDDIFENLRKSAKLKEKNT